MGFSSIPINFFLSFFSLFNSYLVLVCSPYLILEVEYFYNSKFWISLYQQLCWCVYLYYLIMIYFYLVSYIPIREVRWQDVTLFTNYVVVFSNRSFEICCTVKKEKGGNSHGSQTHEINRKSSDLGNTDVVSLPIFLDSSSLIGFLFLVLPYRSVFFRYSIPCIFS